MRPKPGLRLGIRTKSALRLENLFAARCRTFRHLPASIGDDRQILQKALAALRRQCAQNFFLQSDCDFTRCRVSAPSFGEYLDAMRASIFFMRLALNQTVRFHAL